MYVAKLLTRNGYTKLAQELHADAGMTVRNGVIKIQHLREVDPDLARTIAEIEGQAWC
jgi:chromosomal replication initiation ATPase DnaA